MDLRQLQTVLAVIETGSLNKAAVQLGLSQPALTKSIQRLESQLGVKLFERDARGMTPTAYAQALRPYAQTAAVSIEQALAQIDTLRKGTQAAITVAAAPLLASYLFPPAVVAFKRKMPAVHVRVVTQSRGLTEGVMSGEYGLVAMVLEDRFGAMGLSQHFLFNDRMVLVCRPGHPLRKLARVTPKDLMNCSWVHSERSTLHHRRLERYFQEAGLTLPSADIESRAPAMIKEIITRSDHVGVMTRLGVASEVKAGTLDVIELDSPMMARPIGLVWRTKDVLSPALKAFIKILETLRPRLR